MYTNIPNNEFPDIIKTQMENQKTVEHIIKELLEWCKIILNQNYFQHHGEFMHKRIGCGFSNFKLLCVCVRACLQLLGHTNIISLLIKKPIISYFRYGDDILMVFNKDLTNMQDV
jgi:hypothetical protein